LDLVWIAHLVWLAFGVALWARRLGAGDLGAGGAGLLAATAGILVGPALPGIAHLPWLAVAGPVGTGALIGAVGLSGSPAALIAAAAVTALALAIDHGAWLAGAIGIACLVAAAFARRRWLVVALVVAPGVIARLAAPYVDRAVVEDPPDWARSPGRLYRPPL